MKKLSKLLVITLILLLFIPLVVSAKQDIIFSNNSVLFEDKTIDNLSSGNVTVVGGNADIYTNISGSVIVVFGKATISGTVSGDVVSLFGELDVKDGALIQGNLASIGKLSKDNAFTVLGTKLSVDYDFISLFKTNGIVITTFILLALITLAVGLILISIFTKRYRVMSYSMKSGNLRRLIMGFLFLLSATIILAFLMFLIVVPLIYLLLLVFADIVAAIYIGSFIFNDKTEKSTIFLEFFVGHIIVSIFKIVPLILLPEVAYQALMIYGISLTVIEVIMASYGIGTVIDTCFGKDKKVLNNVKQ